MRDLVKQPNDSYMHPDDPGEPSTGAPRVSITELEADLLAALVVGRDVLEIGTGLGVSTRALARTAKTVVTVDVDEWVQDTIWPELPSNVVPSPVVPSGRFFDAAFIDGDHSTEAVHRDYMAVYPLVRAGGLLIAHDTHAYAVRDGLGPGFQMIPTTHGVGILWKGRNA